MFLLLVVAGFALTALVHIAPFPLLLDAAAPGPSIWRMPRQPAAPAIYLTLDDGPNPAATPAVLDVLAREGAVATFFLIDRHITAETAPLVRRMHDEGHAIGLHSGTRALMLQTPRQLGRTLTQAAQRIADITGAAPCRVFRPHAGWRSGQMYEGLAAIDYALVGWGFGLWDFNWYRRPDPDAFVNRVVPKLSDGDIVVLHDGHHEDPRADRGYTVEAVARLVPELKARGFRLGRICGAA